MKFSITPVAFAVTAALASLAAQAQTLPAYGTTSAYDGGTKDGLYLAVWNNTTKYTDLIDLSANYAGEAYTTTATPTSALTTPTSAFKAVSNFDGYSSVLQLDLGTVSNFSSIFPTNGTGASDTHYEIVSAGTNGYQALTSAPLTDSYNGAGVSTMNTSIQDETAAWNGNSNTSPLADTLTTTNFNVVTGVCSATLCDGNEGNTSHNFSVSLGTAAGFWDYARASSRGSTTITSYTYDGNQGFWFLSDTGDLSWNLVPSASTVPLPPAVWLFASGLIGLGAIGRRRQSGLGGAAA